MYTQTDPPGAALDCGQNLISTIALFPGEFLFSHCNILGLKYNGLASGVLVRRYAPSRCVSDTWAAERTERVQK